MYREKVRTVHLNMWFCSFWPFVLFCDVFDRFLLLFDKSQASSGSINPFYASWASIWAQAQPSSSICLEDMRKTMAPIASKKDHHFHYHFQPIFIWMPWMSNLSVIGSCFTMTLTGKNHWETLSTRIFTWGLGGWLVHKNLIVNQLQILDWQRSDRAVRLAIC